uniref:Uncharacterized protein n=1 Tax=Oryza brachyantha TaxID=4533 RepID=J3LLM4_ORYBR
KGGLFSNPSPSPLLPLPPGSNGEPRRPRPRMTSPSLPGLGKCSRKRVRPPLPSPPPTKADRMEPGINYSYYHFYQRY